MSVGEILGAGALKRRADRQDRYRRESFPGYVQAISYRTGPSNAGVGSDYSLVVGGGNMLAIRVNITENAMGLMWAQLRIKTDGGGATGRLRIVMWPDMAGWNWKASALEHYPVFVDIDDPTLQSDWFEAGRLTAAYQAVTFRCRRGIPLPPAASNGCVWIVVDARLVVGNVWLDSVAAGTKQIATSADAGTTWATADGRAIWFESWYSDHGGTLDVALPSSWQRLDYNHTATGWVTLSAAAGRLAALRFTAPAGSPEIWQAHARMGSDATGATGAIGLEIWDDDAGEPGQRLASFNQVAAGRLRDIALCGGDRIVFAIPQGVALTPAADYWLVMNIQDTTGAVRLAAENLGWPTSASMDSTDDGDNWSGGVWRPWFEAYQVQPVEDVPDASGQSHLPGGEVALGRLGGSHFEHSVAGPVAGSYAYLGSQPAGEPENPTEGGSVLPDNLLADPQTVPNMTVRVRSGTFYLGRGRHWATTQNSPAFTPPMAGTRRDLLSIDEAGALSITQGPGGMTAPTYPLDELPICLVTLVAGQTEIIAQDIDDARPMVPERRGVSASNPQPVGLTAAPGATGYASDADHVHTLAVAAIGGVSQGAIIYGHDPGGGAEWTVLPHPGDPNRFLASTATEVGWRLLAASDLPAHGAAYHTGNVLPGANQDLGAYYMDVAQIAAPANPAAGTRRLFTDQATGELSVRTNAGTTVSLEAGATGIAHAILSLTHTDTTAAAVVRGDLMTGQVAAPNTKWTRLAHPGAGRLLTTPNANDVAWGLTAVRGSILVGNATPIWSLLANPGAVGSVLISGATDPSWSTTAQLARLGLGAAADASIPLTLLRANASQIQLLSASGQAASLMAYGTYGSLQMLANNYYTGAAYTAYDAASPMWAMVLNTSAAVDKFLLYRAPAGATATWTNVFAVGATGGVGVLLGLQIGTITPPTVAGLGVGTAPLGAGQGAFSSHVTLAGNLLSTAVGGTNLGSTTYELGHIYQAQDNRHYFGNAQEASIYYASASGKLVIFAATALVYNLEITDTCNVVLGTTIGTKIGTGTTQKLGFWNQPPVVQPLHVADAVAGGVSGGDLVSQSAIESNFSNVTDAINTLLSRLESIGILATS
jgi:hypothetical protein